MFNPEEEEPGAQEAVLSELMDWASKGQGNEARLRLGKTMHPEEEPLLPEEGVGGGMAADDDPELPGVIDPAIPGVEPAEGEAVPSEEEDEEALRAALAAMG